MSSIDKLMVQGIRSFGSGDSQKAVIQFYTPLTLITGQNGAGKTTIIECLKYVTTGDFPPNSKGGAFVHDPKLVREREVRGVVKLKFRDVTGNVVICHRMLQSVQKPRKIEQKTLDSSMEKISPSGEKKKITTRCSEIDREMIAHLGVSKAILSHVIFCHQEESSWPLSEGRALKTKFDEIFASTRYTKALDSIKKFRMEQVNECKVHSAELQHLKKQKEKVEELEGKLKEAQRKVDASKAEVTRIRNELTPVEERLKVLDDMYEEVTTLERRIAEYKSSKAELEKSQAELTAKIEHQFTGTLVELQRVHEDHHSKLERSRQELESVERRREVLLKEEEEVRGQRSECDQEHGRLHTEHEYHQRRVKNRDGKIHSLSAQLPIEGFTSGSFAPRAVKEFLSRVATVRQQREESAKREKQSYVEREQSLQAELNKLRTNLAHLEQSKKMKENTVKGHRSKVAEITRELTSLGSGGAALEGVEQDLRSAEQELTESRGLVDIPALEGSLQSLTDDKRKLDQRVSVLQQELAHISQQSGARGALEALRKDKRNKDDQYQNEMCSLEPDLLSLFGMMPDAEESLESKLAEMERSKRRDGKTVSDKLQEGRSQLSRLQAEKEGITKQRTTRNHKKEVLQAQVAEVCGEGTFEDVEEQVTLRLEKNLDDLSTLKGSQPFFRQALRKVHETRRCPLCTRGFSDESSFENTIHSITSRLNESIPKLLPALEETVRQLQDKQRQLQEIKPKIEELSSLTSTELPQLEQDLDNKNKSISRRKEEVAKTEREQSRLHSELEQIRAIQPRVVKVSQLKGQLRELDQRISVEAGKIVGGASSRSHIAVNREFQDAQMKVEELNRKMDHKRQEMSSSQQMLRQLEDRVQGLREERLKLRDRLQKREGLVTKKGELTTEIDTCEREVKTLSHQLGPVRDRLTKSEGEKEVVVREKEEADAVNRVEVDSLRADEGDIQTLTLEITRYINRGGESSLKECSDRKKHLEQQVKEKEKKRSEMDGRINTLRKQLANARVREHELEDNMQLLRQRSDVEKKDREIKKLREELRRKGLERFEEEYRRLQREADSLRKEQAHMEGTKQGQEEQVRHLQRDLQSDIYRDADVRHRDMLITLKTTQMANSDLEKYYRALDRAIMRYHSLKMEEINKIIKELWIKTYRGGDIDTIEIRSDDETEEAGVMRARRVYHYRVVMLKGDTALDMRGRCSAGQKVLASIIIRLALAETFCINCGLLALDEPTTNLDRENVEGLAQALSDIVKERSKQKNFQLIIITHDEEFVELLGQAGYTDYYYKVSKEVGECSHVKRISISGAEH